LPQVVERAVCLLSGGLDSAVAAALVKAEGRLIYALSVEYGQIHARELEAAAAVAAHLRVEEHRVVHIGLADLGGSALTGQGEVPKDRREEEIGGPIPATYVPARNTVFLSVGLALAEVVGAREVVIGANVLDYSGYPDCRPEYLEAFERMANLATRAAVEGGDTVRIRAPLLRKTKAEIVRTGVDLGLDLGLTWSCYDPAPGGGPCRRCDACLLRQRGFREAGLPDPILER